MCAGRIAVGETGAGAGDVAATAFGAFGPAISRISRWPAPPAGVAVDVSIVTGPFTSNTRRSPLFGSRPERTAVTTPSPPGSFPDSDERATSMTTRDGASNKNALWATGAERSSTTRVPMSEGAMRTPRISAADNVPVTPAIMARSNHARVARRTVVNVVPKNPSPSWSSACQLPWNLLKSRRSINLLDSMAFGRDGKSKFHIRRR
jgi:hypothetical protein